MHGAPLMPELTNFAVAGWKQTISIVGVGTLAAAIAYIVNKIYNLGKIIQRLENVEQDIKDVKKDVRASTKDLVKRIDDLMIAVTQTSLSEAHSPRQLTAEGRRVLQESGIDSIVEDKFDLIVRKVSERQPENAYQAERAVIDCVRHLTDEPAIKDAVEEGAFRSGSLAAAVLYVGALYIRDRVLGELGLRPEEIDNHKPRDY